MAVIVPQPPAKGDARFDQWVYLLWKSLRGIPGDIPEQFNPIAGANVTLTGTYPDITFAASGGGGGTTNNYITQSLTAQDGLDGQDGWPGPMGPAGVAGAAGRAGPPGMDGMDGNGGDGGYTSTPAPDTWILAFAAAHG
ncbi:MAG: hypothetical protein IPK44_25330 [Candidatus Accumulibacter sp.]|uniref:hypothetical protein n=1 Tax=Accumulibacter sp. TaxID=2053492 RepID=UPI00258CE734|nr:hypothetical protein [Accumulibacter sp.]MBK8117612.1 hypothetical protein [Accumulibacter sp.]